MKILTLKYRSISLYDLTRKALFWLDEDSDIIDKVSNFLIFGKYEVTSLPTDNGKLAISFEDFIANSQSQPRTRLANLVEKLNEFLANNREFIFIDEFDVWNLDDTLRPIIHKSLVKLKEVKHGSPYVDNDDVPTHLRNYDRLDGRTGGIDKTVHERWAYVLDEMIFAFSDNSDVLYDDIITIESRAEIKNRIKNGRRLFAKYYDGLWD